MRQGDHHARHRRGAGLDAGGEGRAVDGAAHADPPAFRRASARSPTQERQKIMAMSPVSGQYDKTVDRESAYEKLARRAEQSTGSSGGNPWGNEPRNDQAREDDRGQAQGEPPRSRTGFQLPDFGGGSSSQQDDNYDRAPRQTRQPQPRQTQSRAPAQPRASNRQTVTEAAIKSMTRTVASSLGRALVRGILGSLKKGL